MGDLFLVRTERVEAWRRGSRVIVQFVAPKIRNPLSRELLESLETLISFCESDRTVEEIVFTGFGDVFASGADLKEIAALRTEHAPAFARRGQSIMDRIDKLECHTIAAINGYCYGGGLDLALACDRRIATSNATFCHPGTGLGIITGWGGTQRLPRLVGQATALEIFFTALPLDTRRALEIGLIDRIDNGEVSQWTLQ
jgi:enoyl-CoA hydratase